MDRWEPRRLTPAEEALIERRREEDRWIAELRADLAFWDLGIVQ